MEKPEDIPQWALDKAKKPTLMLMGGVSAPSEAILDQVQEFYLRIVAKAILSAVEEKALKIEAMADALYEKADAEGVDGRDSAFAAWITQNIAAAIRNRKGA